MNRSADEKAQVVADALAHVGYQPKHIRFNYRYSDHEALTKWGQNTDPHELPSSSSQPRLSVAAFHDETEQDWRTMAFACEFDRHELVGDRSLGEARSKQLFELTASPAVLLVGDGIADLWLE